LVRTKILIQIIVSRILITDNTEIAKVLINTKRAQAITKEVMESVDNREPKTLFLLNFSVIQIILTIYRWRQRSDSCLVTISKM
jgi:hypothetical protein